MYRYYSIHMLESFIGKDILEEPLEQYEKLMSPAVQFDFKNITFSFLPHQVKDMESLVKNLESSAPRPVGPGTFPGRPETIVNFDNREYVPGIGSAYGYLEYREPLDDEAVNWYELEPAELKKFLVKVTSVHTLEVEAENEDKAIGKACGMAWEYDADEINGEVIDEESDGRAIAIDLGLADKLDEVMGHDEEYRYQLLSRMRNDCDYFLGNGSRCKKYLWGQEVDNHIAYMKALWLSFQANKKPEWLSFEEIEAYEKRMSEENRHDD